MKQVLAVLLTVLTGLVALGQAEILFDPDPPRIASIQTLTIKGAKEGKAWIIIRDQNRSFQYERSFDVAADPQTLKLFIGRRCDAVESGISLERIFLVDVGYYIEVKVTPKEGASVTQERKIEPRQGCAEAEIRPELDSHFTISVTCPANDRTCEPDSLDVELIFTTFDGQTKPIPIKLRETDNASGKFSATLSFALNANVADKTIQRKVGEHLIDEKPIPPFSSAFFVELFVGSEKLADAWLAEQINVPEPISIRKQTATDQTQMKMFVDTVLHSKVLREDWKLMFYLDQPVDDELKLFVFAQREKDKRLGFAQTSIKILPDVIIRVKDARREDVKDLDFESQYFVEVEHGLEHGKILIAGLGAGGKIVSIKSGESFSPKDLFGETTDVEWIVIVYSDEITPPVFKLYRIRNSADRIRSPASRK